MTATVCLRESQGETLQKIIFEVLAYDRLNGMYKNFRSFKLQTRKFSRKPNRENIQVNY